MSYRLIIDPSMNAIPLDIITYLKESNERLEQKTKEFSKMHEKHKERSFHEILTAATFATQQPLSQGMQRKALLIGAGNCSDIPLQELVSIFDEVVIVEVDKFSIEKVLHLLPSYLQRKITLIIADLTGMMNIIVPLITQFYQTSFTLSEFLENFAAQTQFDISFVFGKTLPLGKNYTFVCSHLVMSQLDALLQGFIQNILEKKYPLTQKMLELHHGKSFSLYLTNIKRVLEKNHIALLKQSVHSFGYVHFADTDSLSYYSNENQQIENTIILEANSLNSLLAKDFLARTVPQTWFWEQIPDKRSFSVISYLLQLKNS